MSDDAKTDADLAERRRRGRLALATAILLIGLPIYIWVASEIMAVLTAPEISADGSVIDAKPVHWAIELGIYLVLGVAWALPLKRLITGLGRPAEER